MVNVQFKPGDMNAAKPHLGIGILAFVVRQMSELVFLTEQGDLMSSSSFTTTADSQKLKLEAPKLPVTIDETINTVKRCRDFHTRVQGAKCAYAIVCNQVFRVLCKKYTAYVKLGTLFGPAGSETNSCNRRLPDRCYLVGRRSHQPPNPKSITQATIARKKPLPNAS